MLGEEEKKQEQALRYAIEAIAIGFPERLKCWYDTQAERDQALTEMIEHVRVLEAMRIEASEKTRFWER